MIDMYDGFEEFDLTSDNIEYLLGSDKVIVRDDLYMVVNGPYSYYVWLNSDGTIQRCVGMHISTLRRVSQELQDITPIKIKGKRGVYYDNHCPDHLIMYYILGNGVGEVNFRPNISKRLKVVWFSDKEMKSVCVAVTVMKGESEYTVELYHLDGKQKRIDNKLNISYNDLTEIVKAYNL